MTNEPKKLPGWASKHNLTPGRNEEATKAARELQENPNQGSLYIPGKNPTLPEGESPTGMEKVHGEPNL